LLFSLLAFAIEFSMHLPAFLKRIKEDCSIDSDAQS